MTPLTKDIARRSIEACRMEPVYVFCNWWRDGCG